MPTKNKSSHIGPRALARSLTGLRLTAIAGQTLAILTVAYGLDMAIPTTRLLLGVGVLVLFAVFALWRLRQAWPLTELEAFGHIAVDTLVLAYLLYLTGGASNPFITMMVVPIALTAAALSIEAVLGVAILCGVVYLSLLRWYLPLPNIHAHGFTDLRLDVVGLAVNFIITSILLGVFILRLARQLRAQQAVVQRIRERALRDEGILAIATQAASLAHEMNTPLSTLRTLLPEIRNEHADDSKLAEDLDLMQSQVERCGERLRDMARFGKAQLTQEPETMTLGAFVHECSSRFRLLRPETDMHVDVQAPAEQVVRVQPGLRHALLNLLNNAADASASENHDDVYLHADIVDGWLELSVRDKGPGISDLDTLTELGYSEKRSGLGLGLALAAATAERMHGELIAHNVEHGAEIRLRLPLSTT